MRPFSESPQKTDNWKCFPFFKIRSGTQWKQRLKVAKEGKFILYIGWGKFGRLQAEFDCVPERILKKEKHFQLSVFCKEFKNAIVNAIQSFWNFDLP